MTEPEVYEQICVGCWREKLCHEDMEFCDEYLARTSEEDDDWYDNDRCYECTGYGDDYYMDDDGEWVSACEDCPFNELNTEDDDE